MGLLRATERSRPLRNGSQEGVPGATGFDPFTAKKEAHLADFVGRRWGRCVYVRGYRRLKNGKWERVRPHLRIWPADPGLEYFFYT